MFYYKVDEDITLKLVNNKDAEEQFNLVDKNRNHLREWLPWVDGVKTVDNTKASIKSARQKYADNNGFNAGIWYKGQMAGIIGLHYIDFTHKSTSIGYWLAEEFVGKGIMTKAVKAVLDYSFNELNLERVEIRCAESNFKSRAIPEKLGFTREGLLRSSEWLYDHFVNLYVYSLLKDEWKKK